MISQLLLDIWSRMARVLEPRLQYIVDDTDKFSPSLRQAIGLNQEQYESLLISSSIRVRTWCRDLFGINIDSLNYL